MNNIKYLILSLLFLSGCATTTISNTSKVDLKYSVVMTLPFTEGEDTHRQIAYDAFYQELSEFHDAEFIGKEVLTDDLLKDLAIGHDNYGVIDFSVNESGKIRRDKLKENLGAKAIVLGSYFEESNRVISIYIQLIDAEDGELSLTFSKVADIGSQKIEDAITELAKKCAQKVIEHIKDNIIITNIKRY